MLVVVNLRSGEAAVARIALSEKFIWWRIQMEMEVKWASVFVIDNWWFTSYITYGLRVDTNDRVTRRLRRDRKSVV